MTTHNRRRALLAAFAALTFVPGVCTIATTPLTGLGTDVISGSAQRLYGTRFDKSFPRRDVLGQAWTALKYGVLGEAAEGAVTGRDGVLYTAEEFETPEAHRDFAAALGDARDRITRAGGELIPVIVPDKARMMLSHARSAHFEARYDRLLHVIRRSGLRTVDLRPALDRSGSYMITDTHWSPSGAQAAADKIGQLLGAELDANTGFETRQVGTRAFEGDLLAFANTGIWKPWVGPASEVIATFETYSAEADGLGLFDEVSTPVVLVGTSFSAREDFHFTGFPKSALRTDVISFATEGHGPFVPMDRFLNSAALNDTSPQFVLWEIPERYLNTWRQNQ